MTSLFLSYRRNDSAGFAGRLADALEAEFGPGSVFRDVDDIRPGEDFVQAIHSHLDQVGAALIMIGPRWLESGPNGQRRLDEPEDFVRREIETALASGKPVLPLLVGGAVMPADTDLPASIAGLARRQAVVLSDGNWRNDVDRLTASLRPLLGQPGATGTNWRRLLPWLAGAALGLALLAWAIGFWPSPTPPPSLSSPQPAEQVAAQLAGRWSARVKYDWGDEHEETFEFKNLGGALHGSASYLGGKLVIEQARVDGEWLSFSTRSQEMLGGDTPYKEVIHQYTGKVGPDTLQFTLESRGGYTPHAPVEFTARRLAVPAQ